jgi:uncharacterized protein involved in exopolysaccharide biosynthesis
MHTERETVSSGMTDESWNLPWREVVTSSFRHRRMIVVITVVGALVAGISRFIAPPLYEARATLMLAQNRVEEQVSSEEGAIRQTGRIDETLVNTEVMWLRSKAVLSELLQPWRTELEIDRARGPSGMLVGIIGFPLRIPGMVYRSLHGTRAPTAFDAWVDSVRDRLVVSSFPKTNVIELSLKDPRKEFATAALEALIAYRMARQASFSQQDEAMEFYDAQSRLLGERVRQAEDALQAFYQREGIVGGPKERDAMRDRLADIRTSLAKAGTELAEARVRVDFLRKALRELPRVTAAGESGASVQNQILALMLERSKLLSSYAPTSVKIVDLDRQIAEAKRLLSEERKLINDASAAPNPTYTDVQTELIQTQANLVALEARQVALTGEERGYLEQLQNLVKGTSTLERLETDLERAKEGLRTYIRKREDARFSNALDTSQILNIAVTEPPAVHATPAPARAGTYALLGALVGLVVGVALAYARDLIDPTVKSAAEVNRLTGLPIIGEVFR